MDIEIEDKLKEIYDLFIEVNFKDFRQYEIIGKMENKKEFIINYLYDVRATFDSNIAQIRKLIDKEIVNCFVYNN